MKLPWTKEEPAQKKRFVGLSNRASPVDKMVSDAKHIAPQRKLSLGDISAANPLKPYTDIIKDDIKRLFHRDDKSLKMKEEYEDFMEHFFNK